ncbi:MAG: HD domain-containing protein [Victivallales bacterium]|nr:HD domain-containing protein [Victivallales bacterium]
MNPYDIICHFYPEDTALRRLLWKHSSQVRDKALAILHARETGFLRLNEELVTAGALLHDIGVGRCHAPTILCTGTEPYLAHGIIGGSMLREYGDAHGLDLEPCARICERHTGTGLTASEIRASRLPLPEQDFLPETNEEKLICLADKFFSKSGDMQEKPFSVVRSSLARFGTATLARFDAMCRLFGVSPQSDAIPS